MLYFKEKLIKMKRSNENTKEKSLMREIYICVIKKCTILIRGITILSRDISLK